MNIRKDFPILKQKVYGKSLIYFDTASTSQKPKQVIDAIVNFYENYNSNVHRGVYFLSAKATEKYEGVREQVRKFINAKSKKEIVFVRGTTEGINLVASSFGLKKGDEILISEMEHHSNIVPWQIVCKKTGAKLKVIPINERGEIIFSEFEKLLNKKTKIVSIVHISNSLGTVNPVKNIIKKAHQIRVPVLIDGAQSAAHTKIDVQALDADFFVFSGHKMYGPTGIGVLYGKEKFLQEMPTYQGGGDMIFSVSFEKTIYNEIPYKFEAGTPNIADTIALGVTIDYIESIGFKKIEKHEKELLNYANKMLLQIKGLKIIGTAKEKSGIISFVIEGIHPHDIGTFLDNEGIAVRTGQHCTEPVMKKFGVPATTRVSFGIYNTKEEINALQRALIKAKKLFDV